jgi:hypothetical protein
MILLGTIDSHCLDVVVEDTTADDGMGMVAPTIEEIWAEIFAPVIFVRISLITGETIDSLTLDTVDAVNEDDPLLLLFPFELSISCLMFMGGGLTILESDLPLRKSIH